MPIFRISMPASSSITIDKMRIVAIALFMFIAYSAVFARSLVFVPILIAIAAISHQAQRFIPLVVSLDLCVFITVVISYCCGPYVGVLSGFVAYVSGLLLKGVERIEYYFTPFFGYIAIALTIILAPIENILALGMLCFAVFIVVRFVTIYLTNHVCIFSQMTYIVTGTLFNYWLFSNIAPILLAIMG